MTNREENKLTMYRAVLNFLKNSLEKLAVIPVFASLVEQYEELIKAIDARQDEHQTVAEGASTHKKTAEDELIDDAVSLCKTSYSYAAAQGDEKLKARFKITESELTRMRDTELLGRVRSLHDLIEEHLSDLAGYGITEDMLTAFKDRIDAYEDALDSRETVSGEKTAARQALTDAFRDVSELLYEQIDPLMEAFRTRDSHFYNQYQAVRTIKDLR